MPTKAFVWFFGLVLACAARAEVHWFAGNLEQALAVAQAKQQPVLLVFHKPNCGPCHYLDSVTFQDSAVVKLLEESTIPVSLNGPDVPDLLEQYAVYGFPTQILLRPNGEEIDRVLGGIAPGELTTTLADWIAHGQTLAELQAALAQDPGNADLKWKLVGKFGNRGDLDAMLAMKARLEKENPDFYSSMREKILLFAGRQCAFLGRPDTAIQFYREIVDSIPGADLEFAYSELVATQVTSGHVKDAFATLEEGIVRLPDSELPLLFLAAAFTTHQEQDRAIEVGHARLKKPAAPPLGALYHYYLARIDKDLARLSDARVEIEAAIALDPQPEYEQFRKELGAN